MSKKTEDLLRAEIRNCLYTKYFYEKQLHENYGINMGADDFKKIFYDPWKNAFLNAFNELKKIASQAVTTIRLAFTLNQKKAEEIVARQKDRMKHFDAKTKELMGKLDADNSDFNILFFAASPGAWAAKTLASAGSKTGKGAIDFAKEIGLSDKSIATFKGDEAEEDALIRRREQDGPIKKALRGLEQIFFLAHASPNGNLITEANLSHETIGDEIMSGHYGDIIREYRKGFESDMGTLMTLINQVAAQNAFLSSITRIETAENPQRGLSEMDFALSELTKIDSESAAKFKTLPAEIKKEAISLANSKKFQDAVRDQASEGEDIDEKTISNKALLAIMGATFKDNVREYISVINENNDLVDKTLQSMLNTTEIDKELAASIDATMPGFKKSIMTAEKLLQRRIIV
ncbi:MAG: hypothetical protein H8E12_10535 [Rhodobacteraceae bacterium]|nr:hypothetical protein [Paracoccaceae bacterium]